MTALAGLFMYAPPEARAANAAWWDCLARALRAEGLQDVPNEMVPPPTDRYAFWRDPRLLFSQTCGFPYMRFLRGQVSLIATPAYDAPGCEGPNYSSAIIVRADDPAHGLEDLRGRRVAYNGADSQSGYNCLLDVLGPLARDGRFVGEALESGSHGNSIKMVARGHADFAAIDSVTLALANLHTPDETAGIRVLNWTPLTPGLPYITTFTQDEEHLARIRNALASALSDPVSQGPRQALLLRDAVVLDETQYDVLNERSAVADKKSYRILQ